MKTAHVSMDEMMKQVSRFKDVTPQSDHHLSELGIPAEAYESLTAKTLYLLMASSTLGGPMAQKPAVVGEKGLSVIVAECPPGDGPVLHAHHLTNETFFCLKGRFEIRWGDDGDQAIVLEPFDMVAVPRGVQRAFKNITDETAFLLVMITGESDEAYNDIEFSPAIAEQIEREHGADVKARFEKIGFSFEAGQDG